MMFKLKNLAFTAAHLLPLLALAVIMALVAMSSPVIAQLRMPVPRQPLPAAVISCGSLQGTGEVSLELGDRVFVIKITCPEPHVYTSPSIIQKGTKHDKSHV